MQKFDVTKYLAERSYLVTVTRKDYGVEIVFPEQCTIEHTVPMTRVQMHANIHAEMITIMCFNDGKLVLQNRHAVPKYAFHAFIIFYTVGVCERLDYNPQMILFFDGDEPVYETDLMGRCFNDYMSDQDIQKARELAQLCIMAKQTGWEKSYESQAEAMGLLDGYNAVRVILGEVDEETPNFMVG